MKFIGPCRNMGTFVEGRAQGNLYVEATSTGTCTVTLVFASGFTFATVVTFFSFGTRND